MKQRTTAIADLDDDLTLKELFGGELPELITPDRQGITENHHITGYLAY